MYTQPIQNLQEAISCLSQLPTAEQKQAFGYIDSLMVQYLSAKQDIGTPNVHLPDDGAKQSFWAHYEAYQKAVSALDDGWTDKEHDELWDNVRDKNDFGREVVF